MNAQTQAELHVEFLRDRIELLEVENERLQHQLQETLEDVELLNTKLTVCFYAAEGQVDNKIQEGHRNWSKAYDAIERLWSLAT